MDSYRLAVTGDVILNTRPSTCREPDVQAALRVLREADVTHAHLEIPLHDFGPGTYAAAEGALSWMRGPTWIAEELRLLGVNLVSTASNHALDYSYGGLISTLEALDAVGLPHAGTGLDLAAAGAPAFAETAVGRVALVSATSSFPAFARAGATRPDAAGRPGVNPMRYLHVVPERTADELARLAHGLGLWCVRDGAEFVLHPPGLHNSTWHFRVADSVDVTTACDEQDLSDNLATIRSARGVSDFVIAHLHVQAWHGPTGRMSSTPDFAHEYAHAAVEAGAGLVLVQGSHAPMRGIEVWDGVPILYDPGPLFRIGRREPQPHDFYLRWGNPASTRSLDADLVAAFRARDEWSAGKAVLSPEEGNAHEPGFVLPVCRIDGTTQRVTGLELHPMTWSSRNRSTTGFPSVAGAERAMTIIEHLAELSAPYGTKLEETAGIGWVEL